MSPRIKSIRPKQEIKVEEKKQKDILDELQVPKTYTAVLVNLIDKQTEKDKKKA